MAMYKDSAKAPNQLWVPLDLGITIECLGADVDDEDGVLTMHVMLGVERDAQGLTVSTGLESVVAVPHALAFTTALRTYVALQPIRKVPKHTLSGCISRSDDFPDSLLRYGQRVDDHVSRIVTSDVARSTTPPHARLRRRHDASWYSGTTTAAGLTGRASQFLRLAS
jgi:hypothetical protein